MKNSKSTAVATLPSKEVMQTLRAEFPVDQGFTRNILPRISMVSQDETEGKGKAMKVVTEAGTFFLEKQGEEEDESGKKVWEKSELGTSIKATIVFQRKQLKFYDSANNVFTSSPIYDTDDQIIPLFKDKKEVHRGTPAELKKIKEYQGVSAAGKPMSKLEDNKILYVLYEGEMYQMNLRGTSMYAYMTYVRELNKEGMLPPTVLTKFDSESKENGAIAWNQMTFENVRPLNNKEVDDVMEHLIDIKQGVDQEKAFYANSNAEKTKADKDFDGM